MKIGTLLAPKPLSFAAAFTFAVGVVGTLPAQAAFAQPALPFATVADRTLFISGTDNADAITVGLGADASTFVVDFGAATAPQVFARADFSAIRVALRGGDDNFAVSAAGQFSDIPLTVAGGRGNDTINGSQGADLLIGGRGNDTIRGGDGDDLILGRAGDDTIDGERGTDTEFLGSGNDTALWVPGEGNDVVDGGRGHDNLRFDGSIGDETFTLTANGNRALLTRNLGNIRMDLDDVEQLDLATLAGADNVTIGDLSGADLNVANLDLSSAGVPDRQLDVVSIEGTPHRDDATVADSGSGVDVRGLHPRTHITGSDTRDELHVATGDGNDVVKVTDAAAARIQVAVDLGSDQH